ncbi:MAG: hypothetical protein AB8H79_16460 [Myxococcota bacterium]
MLTEGKAGEAVTLALGVVEQNPTGPWAADAKWLAAAASSTNPSLPMPEAPLSPEPQWAAALLEARRAQATQERVDRLK